MIGGDEWEYGGYNEIQKPKKRYTLIDRQKLCDILCFEDYSQFISSHRLWVESQFSEFKEFSELRSKV